ncbi:MAG: alpha/beta hydrolase [Clostridium sp.]|jgi:alpha-beta hydrolase superfamily lysophospholipase|nr:alpha/beta hydrolase [Clostridium sp.]
MITSFFSFDNPWFIGIASFFIAGGVVMFFITFPIIFYNTMYRSPKKKRSRECTNTKDPQQMRMFDEGIAWAKQYSDLTEELHIVNEGLNLYGEYINFGYNKCAVILQGRTESLLYSYYFSDVYAQNGYNILVIDVRAHGLSDGKYQTAGIKESDDLVLWLKLIHERYDIDSFTLHGICVGAATAVYTYVKQKNEGLNLIKTIVTDGLYQSYYEMFKQNFRMRKKPVFPMLHLVFLLAYVLAGVRVFRETPMKYMPYIDIPILFLWSSKDIFCKKGKCEELVEACTSEDKEICFFPNGRHSHVRSTQATDYDRVIAKFLLKHNFETTEVYENVLYAVR